MLFKNFSFSGIGFLRRKGWKIKESLKEFHEKKSWKMHEENTNAWNNFIYQKSKKILMIFLSDRIQLKIGRGPLKQTL